MPISLAPNVTFEMTVGLGGQWWWKGNGLKNYSWCMQLICKNANLSLAVKNNRRLLESVSLQGALRNTHPNNSFLLKLGPKCRSDNIRITRKHIKNCTISHLFQHFIYCPQTHASAFCVNLQRLIYYLPFSPQNEVRYDMRLDLDALVP